MDCGNHTSVTEFILLGIAHTRGLQTMLLLLFLAFYLFALLGNLLILLAILASSTLRTPMYFFLGNLSVFDILFPSVNTPKMMGVLLGQGRGISFQGCACQVFFYHALGCTECFLYTVKAYDRFAAICRPLRYAAMVSARLCTCLAVGTWLGGCVHGCVLTLLTFRLPYCGPNEVDSFFCDIPAVLRLARADTSLVQTVSITNVGAVSLTCFLLVLTSYTRIAVSILHIRSSEGRRRAFSTCSAHLTSVLFFYGLVIVVYLRPASSPWLDAAVQVFNNVVTPSLNPLIYSLRNKEVKSALRKVLTPVAQPLGDKD